MHDPTDGRLERLRERRVREPKTLHAPIEQELRWQEQHRASTDVLQAALEQVPLEVRQHVVRASVAGGTVELLVGSAAGRFLVDRWLRDGGEAMLRRACARGITRVRSRLHAR